MGKYSYFKMANKQASIFFDSKSGLMVTQQEPGKVLALSYQTSRKIKDAVKNSFIREIDEEEYNKLIGKTKGKEEAPKGEEANEEFNDAGEKATAEDFSKLNKDQLYTYLKDNYEVSEEDLTNFKAMSKKEMIAYLEDLENGSEE